MLDINGQPLNQGDTAQMLCEVIEISDRGVLVRVMNSELQLLVDAKHDEVLGGLVVGSELTLFESTNRGPDLEPVNPCDHVASRFE